MRARCLLLLALSLAAATAAAQPAARPDPEAQKQAVAHYKKGQAAYNRGAYADAVAEYLAAYDAVPEAELLYNVAQAYRLQGDKPQAVTYYKRYLELDPTGRAAADARAFVDQLEREIAAEAPPEPVPEPTPAPPPAVPENAEPPPPTSLPPAPPAEPDRPARGGRGLKIAGLATGGAGLLGLALGIKFSRDVSAAEKDIADATEWSAALDQRIADGEAAERNMGIAFAVGGAAVIAGGTLYILGMRADHRAEATALRVVPSPGGAVLAVGGSF